MAKLLLDSANIDEINELVKTTAISGVTTNPSLVSKEAKGNYIQRINDIISVLKQARRGLHLSVEVLTAEPEKMEREAVDLYNLWSPDISLHIKIPIMFETLPVMSALARRGIDVNATAAITAMQAKLAADAGAKVVSFFYRRGLDGDEDMEHEIAKYKGFSSVPIICGSIRTPIDVERCWISGADFVTANYKVIRSMTTHPKTTEAIDKFNGDIKKWLS